MNIFSCSSYLELLKKQISDHAGTRGYLTRLSEAAGCQKSYLSLVIKERVHLTPEHAVGLANFWGFDEQESEFFLQLVHLGRTSFAPLRSKIQARLKAIRSERENFAKKYKSNSLQSPGIQLSYYASWVPAALHVGVDIEKLRTAEAMSKRFSLPLETVRSQLALLESLALVKAEGQRWLPAGGNIHIGKDSPLNVTNHQNWRAKAILDAQNPNTDGVHYSSVQTLSAIDFEKIKGLLLRLVDQQREIVGPSIGEEVVCFACDWFKI